MKIVYSADFSRKLSTPGYPLYGISMTTLDLSNQNGYSSYLGWFVDGYQYLRYNLSNTLLASYGELPGIEYISHSDRRYIPCLVEDGKASLSLRFIDSELKNNISLIALYYFDLLKYPSADTAKFNEYDFCKNIDNTLAIIALDSDELRKISNLTTIITLDGQSSWSTLRTSIETSSQLDYVNHYRSSLLNRTFVDRKDGLFIESVSGNKYCREVAYCQSPKDLGGHMCIDSSGVIRL